MPKSEPFWNRDFLLLWQGSLVSAIGGQAYLIAILLWAKRTTESGTIVGIIMFAGSITSLLMPLGGVLADRMPRVRLLVIFDCISGLVVLALAGLFLRLPSDHSAMIPAVLAINFVRGVCTALFHPVANALIPDLVPKDSLSAANSAMQTTWRTATLIGQSVSGLLFRLLGAPLLLSIDGVSFLISAITELFIREPTIPKTSIGQGKLDLLRDLNEGVRFAARIRGFRAYLIEASCANFFIAALFVCLPFYVEDVLSASSDWYGYLLGAMGFGSIVGGIAAGRFRRPGAARGTLQLACVLCINGCMLPLAFVQSPWTALILIALAWGCVGFHQVLLTTLVQKRTPAEMRGRIFSLLTMIRMGMLPIGMAIFGMVIDWQDGQVREVLYWAGAAGLAIGLVAILHPGFRWFFVGDEAEIRLG